MVAYRRNSLSGQVIDSGRLIVFFPDGIRIQAGADPYISFIYRYIRKPYRSSERATFEPPRG